MVVLFVFPYSLKLLLYPHGGSGNHGCEAIVRSTIKLTGARSILVSSSVEEDIRYGLNDCCSLIKDRAALNKTSLRFLLSEFRYHFLRDKDSFDRLYFSPVFKAAEGCYYALSIGGDNYCYGEPRFLFLINKELQKKNIKRVLWGCSINPPAIKGALLDDLKGYDLIIARESITYDTLKDMGLSSVYLFPDPAFSLERKETVLPDIFFKSDIVGINISPMVQALEKTDGVVLGNFDYLIRSILDKTNYSVALIPHVVWAHDDDCAPLKELYNRFKDSERVVLIKDRPAEELKEVISRCRFMIAARTHACIAAYSSCVPTLAIGYSVKAKGLARDIFGTDEHYVLPVQSFRQTEDLATAFQWLSEQEANIKSHYASFMPDYIRQTEETSRLLI